MIVELTYDFVCLGFMIDMTIINGVQTPQSCLEHHLVRTW